MNSVVEYDVLIIGAGPSGAVAAALLYDKGYKVRIIERQHFPRFSIGESLLPQCMEFIEEAGLLDALHAKSGELGFQFKNGAAFVRGESYTDFNFEEKFSPGWGTTYQVQRAPFDDLLARQVEAKGVNIDWGHEIVSANMDLDFPELGVKDEEGNSYSIRAKFVLDASGFGRVLPRLLRLDRPSNFPPRTSLFTHVQDNIVDDFDRDKIRITIHPQHKDVWYWLIPFSNGRCSLGVVARSDFFIDYTENKDQKLFDIVNEDPALKKLLANANFDTPAREIAGYASNVSQLWGKGFALLGNAGEFLDPVFSSGVTIAMKSASLAADALDKEFSGETVDWDQDYAIPLRQGVDTFRVFVDAWYDGRFQDIIFAKNQSVEVRKMICAILAGYAWDLKNPYVKDSLKRMNTLAEICQLV